MLRRVQDWESRLSQYISEIEYEPFRWGRHDCCLMAAGAVQAMTGEDIAAAYRGTYDSARGAAAALREHGAGTLVATWTAALGSPLPIAYAHRGDVVLRGSAVGVCVGRYTWFVGRIDGSGLADETAEVTFEQALAGDLPDDEDEPPIPLGIGRTLIPVMTADCQQCWRVGY